MNDNGTGPTRYIVIRHWDRFQHYRNRRPVFVKLYTEILDNPNYGNLTHAQRSTLCGLWLMYARSSCEIPVDTAWITRQLGVRVTSDTLEALNHAGFIEFSASKPLAPRYRNASETRVGEEEETETEEEKDFQAKSKAPHSGMKARTGSEQGSELSGLTDPADPNPYANGWDADFNAVLDALREDHG